MIATIQRSALVALFIGAALSAWLCVRWFGVHLGVPLAALLGVFCVIAIHPFLVATNFFLSRIAASDVPKGMRLSPWEALKTYDAELDASVRGFWFAHPFLSHRLAPEPVAPLRASPLLFVHGYFCNRALWLPFMRAAARRGFVCEAVTLAAPFDDIDHYADTIAIAIDALLARARECGVAADRVVVIAHSMGGVAVRAAIRRHGAARIARVITLGAPHAGTLHAWIGGATNVRQMRRHSKWLGELDAFEAAHEHDAPPDTTVLSRARYTTVFSYHDNIVAPQETARLAGAHNVALAGIGHVSLVYSQRVREVVFAELDAIEAAGRASLIDHAPPRYDPLPLEGGGLGRG